MSACQDAARCSRGQPEDHIPIRDDSEPETPKSQSSVRHCCTTKLHHYEVPESWFTPHLSVPGTFVPGNL